LTNLPDHILRLPLPEKHQMASRATFPWRMMRVEISFHYVVSKEIGKNPSASKSHEVFLQRYRLLIYRPKHFAIRIILVVKTADNQIQPLHSKPFLKLRSYTPSILQDSMNAAMYWPRTVAIIPVRLPGPLASTIKVECNRFQHANYGK
jgi:hypothetical protein